MRRTTIAAALGVIAACVPTVLLELPAPLDLERSLIVVVLPNEAKPYAVAFDEPRIALPITLPADGELFAFYYDGDLEALQIDEGGIEVCSGPCPDAFVEPPTASRGFFARIAGRSIGPFVAASTEDLPKDLRFAHRPVEGCVDDGGCLEIRTRADGSRAIECAPVCRGPESLDTPATIAAPVSPDVVNLGECGVGFASRFDDRVGIEVCEPDDPAEVVCGPGLVQPFGGGACEPIGGPCPQGFFADDLPPGGVVLYVQAGALGGDGSLARPFGSLTEALAQAPADATIAIGQEILELPSCLPVAGVSLWGACGTSGVRVTNDDCALELSGIVDVHELRVEGGIVVGTNSAVDLEAVELLGAGLEIDGGQVDIVRARIHDVVDAVVLRSGDATIHDLSVADCQGDGLKVLSGTVEAARLVVRRAQNGVRVEPGATVTIDEARVLDITEVAAIVRSQEGAPTMLAMTDAHLGRAGQDAVRVVGAEAMASFMAVVIDRSGRDGVHVSGDGEVDLQRTWIRDATRSGISVEAMGVATARDLLIAPSPAGFIPSIGVALDHAAAELDRVWIQDVGRYGVTIQARSLLSAGNLVIERMQLPSSVALDLGAAEVTVDRLRVEGVAGHAVRLSNAGSSLHASDVDLDASQMMYGSATSSAAAFALVTAGNALLDRILVRGHNVALFSGPTATVQLDDAVLRDSRGPRSAGVVVDGSDMVGGRWVIDPHDYAGIVAQSGATLLVSDLVLDDATIRATASSLQLTRAHLEDVAEVGIAACRSDLGLRSLQLTGVDPGAAVAGVFASGSNTQLEQFEIQDTAHGIVIDGTTTSDELRCQYEGGSSATLRNGRLLGNEVGLRIGSDLQAIQELSNVEFSGNLENIRRE